MRPFNSIVLPANRAKYRSGLPTASVAFERNRCNSRLAKITDWLESTHQEVIRARLKPHLLSRTYRRYPELLAHRVTPAVQVQKAVPILGPVGEEFPLPCRVIEAIILR